MDIVVFKEAFDWFVIRFCLSSLAVLAVATLFLKLASLPSRLKINAKHFGWPAVLLFMVGTAWATFTAFPTQEEKQAYQESLQKQNAINQTWGDAMGLGNLDQGADIEPDAGSSQNEGIESSANTESLKEPERVTEDETVASDIDGLSITAFEIDHHSRAVALEATWREDVFDNAASHCLHLFMATNLQNRLWLPLGLIPVPSYTNVHAFAVTSNDVAEMSRAWFLEAFNGIGFYRLAVDVDSDGDGVADSVERLWAQTNPLCADSDADRLEDGIELSPEIGSNPLAYDTDGDGVGDGDEIAAGSNPRSIDSDGDGVLDNLELQHGTNPASEDSDDDGLPDKWEIDHGVNPISSFGRHGADGDLDDDLLPNAKEYEYGTNPSIADTDGDGVGDGSETGSIIITNAVPWLSFDEADDVTTEISTNYRRCVNRPMPLPIIIQGETVTNMTISGNGIIFLNRAGYDNPGDSTSGENFKYEIDENALVIAPYLEYTYFRTDIPGRETAVKVGTSTYNGEGYLLLEFANAFRDTSTSRTNAISFQVAMPTNCPDHVYVRYKDISGLYMTGDYASIGMQTFDGSWLHSYCNDDSGKVWENLCLEFLFGSNSNPLVADTDEDGLLDGQEISIGISPVKTDTDGDGMNDGWEQRYSSNGFDPKENNSTDANPNNDLDADPDGDGLTNGAEVDAGTNPGEMDTDGDGLNDGVEVEQNSDPNDRADTIPVKWVSVTGDLEMGVAKQVRETVTIPAGTMAFVGVFIFSDEYPYYTDQASEFNDRVVWAVQANGNTTLEGMAHVNNEDGAWDAAGKNGYDVNGFSPVVLKDKAIYRATGDADLPVNINIAAMNVSDGSLPTTVLVGVFPLKVVQANMPTGTGVAQTTDAATSYFRAFIPTNGVAYITAEPAAPQLTAQFKGLPQWINVKWSGSLSTERADRFTYDNRTLVEQVTHGGEGYNINDALNNEIVGGRCTLNASVDGVQISYPFSIRGKNPLDSVARAYITAQVPANTASYAWRISKHECKAGNATRFYNQFNPSRDSYKELPFKGNGANNWGWGLAQIDRGRNNANTSEIYDWRRNVDAMRAKLQEASNNTTRFIGYYSSAYSALPNWTEPPSTNINGQVVSGEIWSILTLYNGSGGIPGQTTPTRTTPFHSPLEFVPATGEWIFHTNSYNPNYVRDVLSDAELQEVE